MLEPYRTTLQHELQYLLHPLGHLFSYVDELVHFKFCFHDVKMLVQSGPITKLSYYGKLGECCPSHE